MDLFYIATLVFNIYLILTVIVLLLDNREPSETFAWIFIFALLPGFGFAMYLLTGRNWRKLYEKKARLPQVHVKQLIKLFEPIDRQQEHIINTKERDSRSFMDDLVRLMRHNSSALVTADNEVKVYHSGQEKFADLIADIEAAAKFIHLQTFIWRSKGELGEKLRELLIRKAREGVEVRILYDFSGCFFTLKRSEIKSFRKAGIEIYPFFNYLAPFKLHTFNYRNHRKIAVIDGTTAYSGGMNVGQEYIDGGKKFKVWRDTHFRITGSSVNIFQAIFAIDWHNTNQQETLFEKTYYPKLNPAIDAEKVTLQVTTSGYDSPCASILQLFFVLITMAQKKVTIVSPYFIPEKSLLTALKTAAMRGVEVTILMAGIPDTRIPFWAASSYFDEVLKAGVHIYQYQAGFLHAKMLSVDGEVCSIGSANFDVRSLNLNYEINTVFYDRRMTSALDQQIQQDLSRSKEITLSELKHTSLPIRLRDSIFRLVSPIL